MENMAQPFSNRAAVQFYLVDTEGDISIITNSSFNICNG